MIFLQLNKTQSPILKITEFKLFILMHLKNIFPFISSEKIELLHDFSNPVDSATYFD